MHLGVSTILALFIACLARPKLECLQIAAEQQLCHDACSVCLPVVKQHITNLHVQLGCVACRDYMGLTKAASASQSSAAVPSISLAGLASSPSREEAPTTPRSSPWRENPAFLPPGGAKPSSADPSSSAQTAPQAQPRSSVSADLSDRLAGMSVVGSGLHRVRETSGDATDSSTSEQGEKGLSLGVAGANMTGRANALGRLKDRQQQAARKTGDEDTSSKAAAPAKFYLQVPG